MNEGLIQFDIDGIAGVKDQDAVAQGDSFNQRDSHLNREEKTMLFSFSSWG